MNDDTLVFSDLEGEVILAELPYRSQIFQRGQTGEELAQALERSNEIFSTRLQIPSLPPNTVTVGGATIEALSETFRGSCQTNCTCCGLRRQG